ncbi:hypothetical protein [Falsiporphyromonas endometrii]|uniref:Uncharacterized protein n=1 Tax=Falsiporphyromonas endometrii TaxID=1387297 RepID=A0ABV9K5W4_9PORP
METIVVLTILLIVMILGGLLFRGGKKYLFVPKQMLALPAFKNNVFRICLLCAVKLAERCLYLLNTIATSNAQNDVQTSFIYNEFHPIWG